jgi:gliding-associated putative ABC transporter substrate-binding component GldG
MALSDKNNFRVTTLFSVLGFLLILVALNVLSDRFFVRWDLTQDRIYSVSPYTRNLLGKLEDLVTVKCFFSGRMPRKYQQLPRKVRDVLEEYREYGGRKFAFEFIDPSGNKEAESVLSTFGIERTPETEFEKNKAVSVLFHHTLVVYYGNRTIPIKGVASAFNLEYTLTAAILKITTGELPTIGFLQGHGERDPGENYQALVSELEKSYYVSRVHVREGKLDPPDPDVLIVAKPTDRMPTRDLFEIDQYIMRGGKVIFLLDRINGDTVPWVVIDQNIEGVLYLLSFYGVNMPKQILYRYSGQADSVRASMQVPYFIGALPAASGHVISRDLPVMLLMRAVPLEIREDIPPGIRVTELIETDQPYYAKDGPPYIFEGPIPKPLTFADTYTVGALFTGTFPSAFLGKRTPPRPGENESDASTETVLRESRPTGIMVITCGDFFLDELYVTGLFSNNLKLILNAVNYFTIGEGLIAIRSREAKDRPLREVSPSGAFVVKALNIGALPLILIIFGVVRHMLRRRKKYKMVREQAGRKPPRTAVRLSRAGVVLLGAGIAAFVLIVIAPKLLAPRKTLRSVQSAEKMFPAFPFGSLGRIKIEREGKTLTIEQKDGRWRLDALHDHPASAKVKELLELILHMPKGEVRGSSEASHKECDLQSDKAARITLFDAGGAEVLSILVGYSDHSTGTTFVRLPDSKDVRVVPGMLRPYTWIDVNSWFEHRLLPLDNHSEVAVLHVMQEEREPIALEKTRVGAWRMDSPRGHVSQNEAMSLVSTACRIQADTVADKDDFEKYGLNRPRAVVKLLSVNGEQFEFHVGGRKGPPPVEDKADERPYYVRRVGLPYIYEVSSLDLESLLIDPETLLYREDREHEHDHGHGRDNGHGH